MLIMKFHATVAYSMLESIIVRGGGGGTWPKHSPMNPSTSHSQVKGLLGSYSLKLSCSSTMLKTYLLVNRKSQMAWKNIKLDPTYLLVYKY